MSWRERMEHMRAAGCIVTLRLGPWGWSCDVLDPDVDGINRALHPDPEEAVKATHEAWEEKRAAYWRKQA